MSSQNKLIFLLLSILLISISKAEEDVLVEDGVLVLTEKNFDETLKKYDYVLVEFYAPWCGHCKQLAPEYSKAAVTLAKSDPKVYLAKIDATQEKDLAERFEIEGFPTLKFFVQQNPIDYNGGRTEPEIVQWCQKKTGPVTFEIKIEDQLQQLQKESQVFVVLFQTKVSPTELEIYNKVARRFEEIGFGFTTLPSLIEKYSNGQDNRVVIFRQFDERQVEFTQEFTEENLQQFIEAHELPTVMEFNQRAAEKIFGENNAALLLLYKKGDTQSQKAKEILKEVASSIRSVLLITETAIDEGLGERLSDYIGVTEKELPAFRIVAPKDDDVKKYYFQEELTADNLRAFVNNFKEGKLKPVFKSEEIPEQNDQPVKIIVGKTWDSIVKDTTKDVLVEFYAPWCGHCKSLTPIYDQLAQTLSSNSNIVIAKIDATANEIDGVPIQGFPTIKYYPSNNKEGIDYDGDRTEKAFLEFLQNNTTFEWTLNKSDL